MTAQLLLDPLPIDTPRVLFDVTRLLRRRDQPFGTGVDRIDLAIGRDLVARFGEACGFVHSTLLGPSLLPHAFGAALLEALVKRWRGESDPAPSALPALARGLARRMPESWRIGATYVVASHSGLPQRRGALDRLDPGRKMRRLAYVHDLIPIDFPEYQRPASAAAFRAYLAEFVGGGSVAFAVNSSDTGARLRRHAVEHGWALERLDLRPPRIAAGAASPSSPPRREVAAILADPAPFFLCVGTVEPRKNHLLLLHLWRDMAMAGNAPRLVIAGRRGWENEMVVDMLERCPAMRGHVVEFSDLDDAEIDALMRATRALLMPSFAEGIGVPLLEAAARGACALVSDLPALREAAGPETVFLDPLDGPAWRREIAARAQ